MAYIRILKPKCSFPQMLDENAQLIQAIADSQAKGKTQECVQ